MLDLQVVGDDEEVDGVEVALYALGEGVRAAHQAADPCTQRAKPAFGMVGLAFFLTAEAMGAPWKNPFVGQPEVAARRPAAIVCGQVLAQGKSTLLAAVADGVSHDLAGASTKRDPEPALLGLLFHEAPKFIKFEHVAALAGQQRVLEGRKTLDFFPQPTSSGFGNTHQRCGGCHGCSSGLGRRRAPAP